MNLKKVLSTQSYWIVNKELARKLGLGETLLLQHFIDLETQLADEGKPFYQQRDRILEHVPISKYYFTEYCRALVKEGLIIIQKRGVPAKNHYQIVHDKVASLLSTSRPGISPLDVQGLDDKDNNKKEKNKKEKLDDVIGKMYFKLVELYPNNRIGNRQHGLKKFKQLDTEQAKLALKNLDRYLKVSGAYVKSLQNYITEECFAEAWLQAEEKTKTNKSNTKIDKGIGVKTFNQNYGDF